MYKDRIGKWGFNKNIKSKKMEAIVRKQVQRSRSGKKSAFCLCNHPVSEHKIRRYRTRFKLLSDEQALTLRAKTPPDLVCYTPLASPMTTPRELETPELIAKLIQEYISGSFYSKMWVIGDGEGCTSTKNPTTSIFDFYDLSNNALTYFGWGEVRRAYQLLDMAVALIRPMLSDQDPQFLRIFFFTLRNLICDSRLGPISNEIALMLLRHFSEMSSVVIGPQHPFSRMFPRLMGLEISMLKHVFSIAHQCQLEGFAKRLGRFSRTMMPFLIERYWDTDHSQSLEHFLALLAELEHALGPSDLRCLRVRLYLAASYFRCEQYGEMAEMAQSVITTALTVQADSLRFAAFHHLSEAQFGLSQFGLAEQNIRQAIYIQAKIYGWEDENVLYLMSHLASWLKGWDRHDEAAEIDRHVQISTDTKYEKLRRKEEEEYQRCLASK